ncbi:MAG TPA: hypothetical protein VLN26_09055 [Gaiellaceae bacterium]|nr:hypothetical protein [Gaiellaceae bacterium]
MSYLGELSRELGAVGIRGGLRRRILAEADDHLRSGGDAARFGAPHEIAERFAAELAPSVSRRGAYTAFAALAVAGGVYTAAFLSIGTPSGFLDLLPAAVAIVAPQVAFVCGSLALLRALRRPGDAAVVGRRAALAVVSGLAAVASVAYLADATAISAATGAAGLLLLAAAPRTVVAARLRAPGAVVGDLRDDLGLPLEPWRIARLVAVGCGVLVLVAGIAASDPIDGLVRAVAESLACLGGFWALGRAIGLRR